MFNNKYSRIYIVCPAHHKTGGLELLHQLAYTLNNLNARAVMAYTNICPGVDPVNDEYKRYVTEYVDFSSIPDSDTNLIIISEHQVELMDNFNHAEVAIWWLSVDNYLKVYNPTMAYKLLGVKGVMWYLYHRRWRYRVSKISNRIHYNLAQCWYAIDYLNQHNFNNIRYLSDYISEEYSRIQDTSIYRRKDVVLYNPKKGKKFTEYLIQLAPELHWVPLQNMTREQVKSLLTTSKVYIDFGNHPGKDRFPREAAICGCCVITDKRGSAGYPADLPIDNKYKFYDIKSEGENIVKRIKYCLLNYDECVKDFDDYREMIKGEKDIFTADVKKIFME